MSYITSCFKSRNLVVATMVLSGMLGFSGLANSANTAASLVPVTSLLLLTEPGPDLVVIYVSVSDSSLGLGDGFTVDATTKNQGDETSVSTTLRYYSSTDSTITTADTQLGTDAVGELLPTQTQIDTNKAVTAPNSEGIYWIGACVDTVTDETNTNNQCSDGVPIDVTDNVPDYAGKYCGTADLVIHAPAGDEAGQRFLMIDIGTDNSVLVTGEDNNVAGNLSGATVTAPISIDITDPYACSGTLNLNGEIELPVITGGVPGSVLCTISTSPIIKITVQVSGEFTAMKTYGTTCPGIP